MSHEIRTPLNAISGMTTIAQRSDDLQKIYNCLQQIDSSSCHLLGVINDILDFSKIEAGKMSLDMKQISLKEDLGFVRSIIQSKAIEKDIRVLLHIENLEHDGVTTDQLRLNQVVINLLSNAVKFSEPGSEIHFAIKEKAYSEGKGTYYFEVRDTGIGISPEHAARLFVPFEQASAQIASNFGGTGLGLAISKNIIEMMNGEIGLQSKPGEGSSFYFTIICDAVEQADKGSLYTEAEAEQKSIDFSGKRCLIVDDIEINREIIIELLSETGMNIDEATNGQEAVTLFTGSPDGFYDLILMDMQMPVLDGCAATRLIRALSRPDAATVRIVAMTANVMQEDIRRSLDAGMNNHIGKPIDLKTLYSVIQKELLA
jgi:CheY-like chemotaxis protein